EAAVVLDFEFAESSSRAGASHRWPGCLETGRPDSQRRLFDTVRRPVEAGRDRAGVRTEVARLHRARRPGVADGYDWSGYGDRTISGISRRAGGERGNRGQLVVLW